MTERARRLRTTLCWIALVVPLLPLALALHAGDWPSRRRVAADA